MNLEYFGIRVTNLERSVKFYTELLGLREVKKGKAHPQARGGVWVVLMDPESGQKLELNWYPEDSSYNVPYIPGEGLDHIGFVVEDVVEKFKELVAKGAEPVIDPAHTEGWIAYVKDPDGNWIELFRLQEPQQS